VQALTSEGLPWPLRSAGYRTFSTRVDLPDPDTAGDHDSAASDGHLTVDVLQVVLARALPELCAATYGASLPRWRYRPAPAAQY